MIINSIEMQNWKCFEKKKITFDRLTLLNWKNGEGKTSLIQAIILCLFDKRPDNLDFASLVDVTRESKLILKFTHNASTYIVEREIGKTSAYRIYKNEELISRTRNDSKKILGDIISESVLTSLWGYEPLSVSNVLNTNYLYDILTEEFKLPLDLKQYFNSEKTYAQKRKSSLEKQITNQTVTEEDIKKLKQTLDEISAKIKEKAFISDNEVVKAKKAKEDFEEYKKIKAELDKCKHFTYDRETCVKLKSFGKTKEEWETYFKNIEEELAKEKSKATASPLIKYPKSTISALITESKCNDNTCILCGGKFVEPKLDYDTIDNDKIQRLEDKLKDRDYDFDLFMESIKYWHFVKLLSPVEYSADVDFESVLNNYNADTNKLYDEFEQKTHEYENLNKDFSKISELLDATKQYDENKTCIGIIDEYIAQAKDYYADSITKDATTILHNINSRYLQLFIENGVYKVELYDKDYTKISKLAVQSLSKGERTIVALSLILTIRNMFMKDLPLIMDESFANLDANNVESIKRLINEDTSQWIIVSHDERLL